MKDTLKKMKREVTDWEKYLKNHITQYSIMRRHKTFKTRTKFFKWVNFFKWEKYFHKYLTEVHI